MHRPHVEKGVMIAAGLYGAVLILGSLILMFVYGDRSVAASHVGFKRGH
jgi:hypothetical protein